MVMPEATLEPCRTKFTRGPLPWGGRRSSHSPSPKRSAISARSAASAASASSPCASTRTEAPLPAASIITPMMLLALTRRPLRVSQTSLLKPLATWVSLAEARACRPSLLTMVSSALATAAVRVHVHHALGAAGERALHRRRQRAVAPREHAHQHRQRDAGYALDATVGEQARGHVAGGGA